MRNVIRYCLLALICIPAVGCVSAGGGRVSTSPSWAARGGSAGNVLLVMVRPADAHPPTSGSIDEVRPVAVAAVGAMPATRVLNAADAPAWSPDLTDGQAVALAKAHGADSVCVVTVLDYSTTFWIALEPCWEMRASTTVSVRLLDARTGEMLANDQSTRRFGGPFAIVTADDLRRTLRDNLARALRTPSQLSPS